MDFGKDFYATEARFEDRDNEAPHVDNGNAARLVEVIQKARQLAR